MTIAHPLPDSLSDPLGGPFRDVVSRSTPETAEAIAQQIHEQTLAVLLPEQEWCEDCSRDDGPGADSGMPQDIVGRSIEPMKLSPDWNPDRDDGWGPGALYDVIYLACGHTVAHPAP